MKILFAPHPTSPVFQDLTGRTFNRLTVLGYAGRIKEATKWHCKCECGTYLVAAAGKLKDGHTRSCGCLQREIGKLLCHKHGMRHEPEYAVWRTMKARCLNPRNKKFADYGGRGITVCDRWREFKNFITDVGRRPSTKHSIERIDNEKGYSPDNAKWDLISAQANNRRNNRLLTLNGETATLACWCSRLKLNSRTIQHRLARGWSDETALTTPIRHR